MKCPSCGHENIGGADDCEYCTGNLSSIDGVVATSRIERVLMEDPISKLKPREATWVKPRSTVLEAVRKMNRDKVGCALVTDGEEPGGILTERDIVFKILGQKKDPASVTVESVMTAAPEILSENDTLAYALNEMAVGGYRHIPIRRRGKSCGIISVRDVLKYLSKLFPETSSSV